MSERARKGQGFAATVRLTHEVVSRFARAADDDENPLHNDDPTRRIARGPRTCALLMAATTTHFSRSGPTLGLELGCRFRRRVPAEQRVRIEWLVVDVRPRARLGGDLVDLRGRQQLEDGATAVGARGLVPLRACGGRVALRRRSAGA